jgi:hypothetical protein
MIWSIGPACPTDRRTPWTPGTGPSVKAARNDPVAERHKILKYDNEHESPA